jgi:hypothetical protein
MCRGTRICASGAIDAEAGLSTFAEQVPALSGCPNQHRPIRRRRLLGRSGAM